MPSYIDRFSFGVLENDPQNMLKLCSRNIEFLLVI
jgi:hypothetical protein